MSDPHCVRLLVRNNKYSGIIVNGSGSIVIGNTCIGNNTGNSLSDAGIYIGTKTLRVRTNHVTASGYAGNRGGQRLHQQHHHQNSVSGNGANNYSIPAGQVFGPLITNTGFWIITNSNPWANFSF